MPHRFAGRAFAGALLAACLMPAAATARTVAVCEDASLDRARGVATQLAGCGSVSTAGGPVATARRALARTAPALGLRGQDVRDLRVLKADALPIGDVVRFEQTVGGIPVRDAQVVVATQPGSGTVDFVGSSAAPQLTPNTTTPAITRERAQGIARARVPGGVLARPVGAELVVDPATRRLAWDARVATSDPAHEWRVLVDATTGEILDLADELRHVDGSGLVYDPNPVQTTNDKTLVDNNDATSLALDAARRDVVLTDLAASTTKLTGTFADVAPGPLEVAGCVPPYVPGQADDAGRNYDYTREDDRFEEASAYHAITKTARTYQRLGFTSVMDHAIKVNVHCTVLDNSFYSSGDRALHMGDGGVDDAEDADVTVHEYGHATHDDQVPGFGPGSNTEQRAIGEGFGDLLAALIYIDAGDATYQSTRRHCVAEWDAQSYNAYTGPSNGSGCLRWTNGIRENDGTAIGNFSGTATQEHGDGRFWSAAMTCILEGIESAEGSTAVARDTTLRLVLGHHALLTPTEGNDGFDQSVNALLQVDRTLFSRAHLALIEGCTEARLAVPVNLDTTPPVVTAALTPGTPDGTNGWYKSDISVDWTVTETPPVQETGCADTTIAADTANTTLTCTATSDGGSKSESVTVKRDATAPTLTASVTPASPTVGESASAQPTANDGVSGVATSSCDPVDTTSASDKTVACRATDVAGNTTTISVPYTVKAPPTASPSATASATATPGPTATPTPAPRLPRITLGKPSVTRDGRLRLPFTADRAVIVTASVKIAGRLTLGVRNKSVRARRRTTLTLSGSKPARNRLLRNRRSRKLSLKVTFSVRGVPGTVTRKISVARAPR